MKLSTRTRYGVRFMLEIAANEDRSPVLLKKVAERQDISEKYLSQIVIPLKNSGLINSSRSGERGYTLGREASSITVLDIAEVLEGDLSPVGCVKHPELCARNEACVSKTVWEKLYDAIRKTLSDVTLKDLVDDLPGCEMKDAMYFI
jgi:Rrf2 family cysteine metabolism transcriptional repressor